MVVSYREKLRDPRWQRRRLEKLQQADFSCEACKDESSTLNVHHRHYVSGREPWEYMDSELSVLCERCHGVEHQARDVLKQVLMAVDPSDIDWYDLVSLIAGFLSEKPSSPREFLESVGCSWGSKDVFEEGKATHKRLYEDIGDCHHGR